MGNVWDLEGGGQGSRLGNLRLHEVGYLKTNMGAGLHQCVLEQYKSAFNPFSSPMKVDHSTFRSQIEAKKSDLHFGYAAGECLSQDLMTNSSELCCCFLFENSPVFTRKTK